MDLREALEAAGIEIKDGSSDDEIRICCPFCMEEGEPDLDDRYRLGINISTGEAHCFNCGKKGHGEFIFNELQRILDTGEIEAAQKHRKKKKKRRVKLPEDFELLEHPNGHSDTWSKKAWRYVRSRGVTEKQIIEKKVGYSLVGEMHHRVVFCVYRHNKLLGMVGRDFTDEQELKYLNSVGDKAIYNLPDSTRHKSICLSEGVFDALRIERGSLKLGIDSVALLGHDIKDEQLEILINMGYRYFYIWFDPDEAGVKGTIKVAKKIPKDKIVYIVLPKEFSGDGEDNDPSELEHNEISRRLRRATRCSSGLLDKLHAWMVFEE